MADLSYVNYNFNDLVQQLQDRVKQYNTWKSTYRSGTGEMLIEFYGYVGNLVMHTIERAFQEGYLELAQNKSSVINLVRLLGYIPKRAVSATGTVTFTLAAPHSENVYLPQYTKLNTSSGLPFLVTLESVIIAGQTSKDVAIIQGIKIAQQITSSGALNQEYLLNYTDIENSSVVVKVNSIVWTAGQSFVSGTPTAQTYRLRTELNDTLTVMFGDNIIAKSPDSGDIITITYLRSSGAAGNVIALGGINVISDPIFDAANVVVTDISVTNADAVQGGADAETIEDIRANAPNVFATGDRAVTKSDYNAILDNYSGVSSTNAWGENEETPPNYSMFNRVKICLVLENWVVGSNIPASFKSDLSDYLYTKAQLTVKYTYVDAVIVDVIPVLDVKVIRGSALSTVQTAVESALADQFSLGLTAKLGFSKRLADMMYVVEAVPGVDYHSMTLDVYKEMTRVTAGNYTMTFDLLDVVRGSARLYINGTLAATDNGLGAWISSGGTYTVIGTVNYNTTGAVTAAISVTVPSASDIVSIRYNQDPVGDLVIGNNQICRLNDTDITIAYSS